MKQKFHEYSYSKGFASLETEKDTAHPISNFSTSTSLFTPVAPILLVSCCSWWYDDIMLVYWQVSVVNQANTFAKQVSNQWQTAVATDELAGADIPHCQSCCICLYYWYCLPIKCFKAAEKDMSTPPAGGIYLDIQDPRFRQQKIVRSAQGLECHG